MRISIPVLLVVLLSVAAHPASLAFAQDHPWSVPASWTVDEQEVRFESDGVELAGTLYVPEGIEDGPALVVVQQAGTQTRNVPLFVQTAEVFTAIGYSVLLYDRRGHGESEGDPARPDYQTLAKDAVAAQRAIAETDAVHPDKIGFWGLSQSGWLAMEAGAMSDAAFVVSVSAPLTTPGEQMETLVHNYVLVDGHGEEAARKAREVRHAVAGEYFRGERSYASARALLAEVEEEPWFARTMLPEADELPVDVEGSTWIREMAYDPVTAFERVEAPLLFVLGSEDFDIPVARTLEIIDGLEPRGSRKVVVIPGASHLMRIEDKPQDQLKLSEEDVANAAAYFMVVGEWRGGLGLQGE